MAGYLGTKAVLLSTTAADVTGNAEIGGDLTVGGNITSTGIDDNASSTAITIDGSQNVGIGTSSPADYNAAADNLVVGTTSGNNGITIASGSSEQGSLFFADGAASGAEEAAGYLIYEHASNFMAMGTQNTERMRIDDAGRVTMPYQPAFNAKVASNTAISGSGWDKVPVDTIISQAGGSNFSTSLSRYTAPVSGWYFVSLSVNFIVNADADGALGLAINGSQTNSGIAVMQAQNGGSYNGRSTSGAVYLNANDYIEMHVYHTVDLTTRATVWGGFFSGYLLG